MARFGDGQSIGERRLGVDANDLARAKRFMHGRRVRGSTPMMRTSGRIDLIASAHPRDQSPAADWDDDDIDVRHILQNLQPNRPLAGDDVGVVEARDVCERFLLGEFCGVQFCFVVRFAVQDDVAPSARQLVSLTSGARLGMTTVTGTPSSCP